jgi:hypothetical protein
MCPFSPLVAFFSSTTNGHAVNSVTRGAGWAGVGDVEGDVGQVVLPGAADLDQVVAVRIHTRDPGRW